jgi:uncharacterized protein (TIGR02996 family)
MSQPKRRRSRRQDEISLTPDLAFIRAIVAQPEDEALWLIYADYLDEQGDARAAFVRSLQPVSLGDMQSWLRPMEQLDPSGELFHADFSQGFVTAVELPARMLIKHGAELFRWGPLVREATLYKVRKAGPALAASPHLRGLDRLEIGDWIRPEDAAALAASPQLGRLRSLCLWLGSAADPDVCRTFASPAALPELSEIVLRQLHGGCGAGDRAGELARRADGLADRINKGRRRAIARVYRPFDRRFPLDGDIGYDLYAGKVRNGRLALAGLFADCCDSPLVLHFARFNADGVFLGVEWRDLTATLVRPPEHDWERYHPDELLEYLGKEYGFALGRIEVREFVSEQSPGPRGQLLGVRLWTFYEDRLANPDVRPFSRDQSETAYLAVWAMRGGFFDVLWWDRFTAGPDGKISGH